MRLSRERIFRLADQIVQTLAATPGLVLRSPEDTRLEIVRTLSDESRVEETVDQEVRGILASYARRMPEGSAEWQVMYAKTRDEVLRRRFRT